MTHCARYINARTSHTIDGQLG